MVKSTLWTKNFTIITLGTVVSMLGNAISGFAISLMVLEYTGSVFLYALFMAAYNLPKLILPLVAGPYLDNFSRAKVIYTLDFISAGLYLVIFLLLRSGYFSYFPFLMACMIIGSIDSIYQVAYDSLYPLLVSEGNFTKAYSISSLLYPLSAMMVPVASFVYERVGFAPLFLFNAVTFFIAATMETQIKADEAQIARRPEKVTFSYLKDEFRQGFGYIKSEKGLMVITAYFFVTTLLGNGAGTLWLPYFQSNAQLGVTIYTFVMGCNVFGRLIGGLIHYRFKYPTNKKFAIALMVYTSISFLDGGFLYFPVAVMMIMSFMSGALAVTSYNIRISTTQSYIPNDYRARFNGTFQMICSLGGMAGNLAAGALGEFLPYRPLIAGTMAVNLVFSYLIVYRGKEHVKKIYNRDV